MKQLDLTQFEFQPFECRKRVEATPMTRLAYNEFRGWSLPEDENGDDEGLLVVSSRDQGHQHVSWIPKDVFFEFHRQQDGLIR